MLWIAKNGNLDPDKTVFFQTHFLLVFEKWDPDIFPKSQISKISFSSHSENAHIKLNGSLINIWRLGQYAIFFYGLDVESAEIWGPAPPTRAVYPPAVGLLVFVKGCLQ